MYNITFFTARVIIIAAYCVIYSIIMCVIMSALLAIYLQTATIAHIIARHVLLLQIPMSLATGTIADIVSSIHYRNHTIVFSNDYFFFRSLRPSVAFGTSCRPHMCYVDQPQTIVQSVPN